MHKQLLLLCLMIVSLFAQAQTQEQTFQITGQAIEASNGKSIPYATVSLLIDSTKTLKKISSDLNGKFSFQVKDKRDYTVVVSFMGFQEKRVAVTVSNRKTDVGKIPMDEGLVMKEVSIVAQKPLVKVDPDKLTYSVDADPDAQTSNALDILKKIPLITVDSEDNVTLNGQSNFKVLVNGKSSAMMSNNFKDVIKSLPANSIKDIEVITNPSSKYDAEGVGGIINIITTKKKSAGYNGSVTSGIDSYGGYNGSLYLAAKINKFSFSTRFSAYEYKSPGGTSSSERTNFISDLYRTTTTSGQSKNHGSSNNFSGELSYEIDSLNLISSSFWGYNSTYRSNSQVISNASDKNNVRSQYFENQSNGKSKYGTFSGNIDYQRTFKKPEKTFTISYKLDNSPNSSDYESTISHTINYSPYSQRYTNDAFTREQTFQTDYYDPLSAKHQIECGIKGIFRQNDSNSDTYLLNYQTNAWEHNQARSNELDYNQYILSGYAGYVFKLKSFTAKSGLRSEFTWNHATSTSSTIVKFSNQLQNIVPYITLNYQLKPGRTIKISYTQRLYRPGIWYLNPYVNTTDPQNISFGNPHLKAEISNSFELGYNSFAPKFNFSITGRGAFTNNSIESISSITSDGVRSTTYQNIGTDMNLGVSLYASYRPNAKFNIYCNSSGRYVKLKANNGSSLANKGFTYNGYFGSRFVLWKNSSISINGGIYSSSIMLQGKSSVFYYHSIGVAQYFLKKKLSLNLSVSDPLRKKWKYTYSYTDPSYIQESTYYSPSRRLRIAVTYNFGKMKTEVKKAKRGIQNDDVKSGAGGEAPVSK